MNWKTKVISKRKDFESLFEGFKVLRAISYVASPLTILDFFDRYKYEKVEILVGENLSVSEEYRDALLKKKDVIERMVELIESGKLKIFIPKKTIHTKMFILEQKSDSIEGQTPPEPLITSRVIISSANLTESAQKATRQTNYAVFWDLPADNPSLRQFHEDYDKHFDGAELFMEDLVELFQKEKEIPKHQLINMWLDQSADSELDTDVIQNIQSISLQSLEAPIETEKNFIIRLPEKPEVRKGIERFLSPVKPSISNNNVQMDVGAFFSFIQERCGIPLMRVDLEKEQVRMGFGGKVLLCTGPLPDKQNVNLALEHIESYINTVDLGRTSNPIFVKTSMFEALLYILSAPFANEYMKLRRQKFGFVDLRGPRFLLVYGPSGNGKTSFVRFCLRLLSGHSIEPISSKDFRKGKIRNTALVGTAFPLIFDDVSFSKSSGIEETLKSYWEIWWKESEVIPQIIMTSNHGSLKDWAKTRIKRVDFDIQFDRNDPESMQTLSKILSYNNSIFHWFSFLYIEYLRNGIIALDDELSTARLVMQRLYKHAQRPLPEFFPSEPVERIYDPGRRSWIELFTFKKVTENWEKGRLQIVFTPDMQDYEINRAVGLIPQSIKYKRFGHTIIVETPDEFNAWLGRTTSQPAFFFSRILGFWKK
jgi:hypothetical protein